ncbi:MAG: tetratricopeptide repeat protein [Spirochaetales bacterium]|nr:tetratricopeptide repeat protein [Spirochaetales bacterium]
MKEDPSDILDNIVYISIPDDLEGLQDLPIDPSVLLPVELQGSPEDFNLQELSWVMIVSAMLRILAYNPAHEHADYYRTLIKAVKPDIREELLEAGVIKARNKDFPLAEEIFLSLRNLDENDLAAAVNLALSYEEHGEAYEKIDKEDLADYYFNLAFEAYKQALEVDSDNPDVHMCAGTFFLKRRNFEKALLHLERFVDLAEDSKKRRQALDMITRIKSRTRQDVLFTEAYDFIKMGKEREGIQRIEEFLQENPGIWNAWFLLGWAHRRLGQYQEGRKAFYKALEYGSVEADTHNELAICLLELGEYSESKKELEKALRIEPENTKIISNMGILAIKQENPDLAAGFFRTVLDLNPDDEIAKKYLEFLGFPE